MYYPRIFYLPLSHPLFPKEFFEFFTSFFSIRFNTAIFFRRPSPPFFPRSITVLSTHPFLGIQECYSLFLRTSRFLWVVDFFEIKPNPCSLWSHFFFSPTFSFQSFRAQLAWISRGFRSKVDFSLSLIFSHKTLTSGETLPTLFPRNSSLKFPFSPLPYYCFFFNFPCPRQQVSTHLIPTTFSFPFM